MEVAAAYTRFCKYRYEAIVSFFSDWVEVGEMK
jgi:hypothetical protein